MGVQEENINNHHGMYVLSEIDKKGRVFDCSRATGAFNAQSSKIVLLVSNNLNMSSITDTGSARPYPYHCQRG